MEGFPEQGLQEWIRQRLRQASEQIPQPRRTAQETLHLGKDQLHQPQPAGIRVDPSLPQVLQVLTV
jgi:hypothetical protein